LNSSASDWSRILLEDSADSPNVYNTAVKKLALLKQASEGVFVDCNSLNEFGLATNYFTSYDNPKGGWKNFPNF
jgi:hypothetical protein